MGEAKRRRAIDPSYGKTAQADSSLIDDQVLIWSRLVYEARQSGKNPLILVGVPGQHLDSRFYPAIDAFLKLEISKDVSMILYTHDGQLVIGDLAGDVANKSPLPKEKEDANV